MSEPELRPCPWCGETPVLFGGPGDSWHIICESDDCPMDYVTCCGDTKSAACAAWNSWGEEPDEFGPVGEEELDAAR